MPVPSLEEFQALCRDVLSLRQEVVELRAQLPEYVDEVEAQRLTGLSRQTLFRERQKADSLIKWKSDRGVRYLRTSLLAHNNQRAVGRGHLAHALAA